VSDDRGRGTSAWVYRGIWSGLTDWFKVPAEPPSLPALDGEAIESFRPAAGFLRYMRFKFWLVFLLIDCALLVGWVVALALSPLVALLLLLPLLLLIVVPDVLAYLAIQLRYDTTWYVLSDRRLRIRRGIMTITETTITFDNVQNVKLKQGPLQRHFGIGDLVVETAGGGQTSELEEEGGAHIGLIEGVADAQRIRDLILSRVRGETRADPAHAERWPEPHLTALREVHSAATAAATGPIDSGVDDAPLELEPSTDDAGAVEGLIGWLFRLPSEPPTLPAWAGDRQHRFRPARVYLWYQMLISGLAAIVGSGIAVAALVSVFVKLSDLRVNLNPTGILLIGGTVLTVILTLSLLTAWLQYRVTWYVLAERGLRIRRGVWTVRETTISFDNVQNVNLQQNPIGRLFGLSTVGIHTAGGGGPGAAGGGGGLSTIVTVATTALSIAFPPLAGLSYGGGAGKKKAGSTAQAQLVGIVDAAGIRDRVMARVRLSRAAGLGDDGHRGPQRIAWSPAQIDVLREVRDGLHRG